MDRHQIERGRRARRSPATRITIVALLLLALFGARSISSYIIEVEWWKELGQLNTWLSMLTYSIMPLAGATALAFAVLWVAHARALKFAGTGLGDHTIVTTLCPGGKERMHRLMRLVASPDRLDASIHARFSAGRDRAGL